MQAIPMYTTTPLPERIRSSHQGDMGQCLTPEDFDDDGTVDLSIDGNECTNDDPTNPHP